MKKVFRIFLAIVFFYAQICFAQENQEDFDASYRLNINDLLEIQVYQEPDLSKVVRVAADGMISFPLLGSISVKGLTSKELEDKITQLLREDYLVNPQVSVFIREYAKISILGQVRNPGTYELKSGLTVIDAIALAGGFTEKANVEDVKLVRTIRNEKKTIQINANDIIEKGQKEKDVSLVAGDLIIAGELSEKEILKDFVVVLGQVKKPGKFEYREEMSVIDAIAEAGGLTDIAAADKTKIIRMEGGRKKIIIVPVGKIMQGINLNRDIRLQPDDTIVVPESFF